MSSWSKSFSLILIISALIANVSILAIETVSGKSNTVPTISIVYPKNETLFNVTKGEYRFYLEYQTSNTLSWVGYNTDGGENSTVNGNYTLVNVVETNGSHVLTLYANDTYGIWATPQTIIYLVSLRADTTSAPKTPSVPEFSWLAILPMLIVMFSVVVILRHRKTISQTKSNV